MKNQYFVNHVCLEKFSHTSIFWRCLYKYLHYFTVITTLLSLMSVTQFFDTIGAIYIRHYEIH